MRRKELVGGGPSEVGETAPGEAAELPDEDVFVLPEAWRRWVVPRRRPEAPAEPWHPAVNAAAAAEQEARLAAEEHEGIETILTSELSDPEVVRAVRSQLAGAPDPLGAAVLVPLLRPRDRPDWPRWQFDSWVARFGPEFAVRAALRMFDANVTPVQARRRAVGVTFRQGPIVTVHGLQHSFGVLRAARAMLAGVSEPVYLAALAALEEARSTPLRRAVAAYLAPERVEWVEECLAGAAGPSVDDPLLRTLLVHALGSPEQVERFGDATGLVRYAWRHELVATLADGVGIAAAPLVRAGVAAEPFTGDSEWCAGLLAGFPTDGTMQDLVDRIADKHARVALLEMARRQPVRAIRVLSAAARAGGGTGRAALRLLNGHVAELRPRLPEILPRLDAETAGYVLTLDGAREPMPEAAAGVLPALLVSPPWTRPRTARRPKVLTGVTADDAAQLHWLDGEREAFASADHRYWRYPADTDWAAEAGKHLETGPLWYGCRILGQGPAELLAPYLETWQPRTFADGAEMLPPVLAKYGTAALRLVHGAALAQPAQIAPVLLPVLDATVAGVQADVLARLKSARPVARSWFARHGVAGALLLVPAAVGKAGRARAAAEGALRLVAASEGTDVLLAAVTERYGDAVSAVVAEALGADPLENALPARMPDLPEWLRPAALPQLVLREGGALPLAAVRPLLTMLQLGRLRDPYPGVQPLLEAFRPGSAAGFAWELFEDWRQAGMPAQDSWALYALGELGDDDTARRLAPVLREWPGQGANHRAVEGLDVLAAIGTDVALMQLHGIAQRVKFKALRARAQEKIAEIAESLGLTTDQLGDRLVPDLGLDANGSTVLDYGSRTFTVGFDEQLRPYVLDGDGRRRKDLPAPGAKDDPELAPAARKRFAALKKDVRALAADQILRLEAAMVAERTWTAGEFRDLLVGHPLLGHLVRRLVWLAGPEAFRVAEDRTFADLDDRAHVLADDAVVRLAHPLHLGDRAAAWAELFADYELIQPFRQLGRPVLTLTEEEAAGHRLHRFENAKVPVGRLLGLTKRGWLRGTPQDAGVERWFHKPLPDGRHLVIELDPGIWVGVVTEFADQRFDTVWLDTAPGDYPAGRPPTERFADLHPITASELLADLEELTAT